MSAFTIEEIRRTVGGRLTGDPTVVVTGVEEITAAGSDHLTFVGSRKYVRLWNESRAAAAIVTDGLDIEPGDGRALVHVADADLAMASVLVMFAPPPPRCGPGVHPTAVVDAAARIGANVIIGAGCYIGPGAIIGEGSLLYPNVTVMDGSTIGPGTVIWPGTVIRERCRIGRNCILQPNVTIGADGFGYRPSPDGRGLVKIPQIGTVTIGDDVEIGAGSCVDRGKFSSTVIGDGTKIDNQVQIAHNCTVGRSCVLAGQAGLAGSATLGDGVVLGGGVRVKDHTAVGDGTQVGGNSTLFTDVGPGKRLLGTPADDARQTMRRWAALKQLPDLLPRLKKLPE